MTQIYFNQKLFTLFLSNAVVYFSTALNHYVRFFYLNLQNALIRYFTWTPHSSTDIHLAWLCFEWNKLARLFFLLFFYFNFVSLNHIYFIFFIALLLRILPFSIVNENLYESKKKNWAGVLWRQARAACCSLCKDSLCLQFLILWNGNGEE